MTIPHEDSLALLNNMTINPEDTVLDVFCGAGTVGICAARVASKVVGLDRDPAAVKCAQISSKLNGVGDSYEARESDVFSALGPEEQFSVITANAPFVDYTPPGPDELDNVNYSFWDPGLRANNEFIDGLNEHLKPGGRVYLAQSNFGNFEQILERAAENGFDWRLIGQRAFKEINDRIIFLAFELTRKS